MSINKFYKIADHWYYTIYKIRRKGLIDFWIRDLSDESFKTIRDVKGKEIFISGWCNYDGEFCFDFNPDDDGVSSSLQTYSRCQMVGIGTLLGRVFDQCAEMINSTQIKGAQSVIDDGDYFSQSEAVSIAGKEINQTDSSQDRITYYGENELDEVVATNPKYIHLEQMDKDHYWIGISLSDGKLIHINLWSDSEIKAVATDES